MEKTPANDASLSFEYEYFSLKLNQSEGVPCALPSGMSGKKEFTLTAWVYLSDLHTAKSCVCQQNGPDFGIEDDALYFEYAGKRIKTQSLLLRNIWNHIALVVYDSSVQLYLNGTKEASGSYDGIALSKEQLVIGRQYFGYIRNVMLYQRALITDEVEQKMYTEVPDKDVVLCCDFTCNPPIDRISGKAISLSGGAAIVKLMPAASFTDYSYFRCTEGRTDPWFVYNYPFTIQAWISFTPDTDRNYYAILSNVHPLSDSGLEIGLIRRDDGFHVCVYLGDTDNPEPETDSTLSEKAWHNIALVYDTSKLDLYIDCVLAASTDKPEISSYEKAALLIGARHSAYDDYGDAWYNGYIARMDVWSTALSDADLKTYAETVPEVLSDYLTASWSFIQDNVTNAVTDVPLSKINDVRIIPREEEAAANTCEIRAPRQMSDEAPVIPQDIIDKARAESGILEQTASDDCNPKMSIINTCVYRDQIYFLRHDAETSYPITCIADDTDEVIIWCIQLVLIVLDAIINLFLHLKTSYSEKLALYIRRHILPNIGIGRITSHISSGQALTIAALLALVKNLLLSGHFKQLLLMACSQISFWTFVSFVVGIVRKFVVGAAETIVWATTTIVQVGYHCIRYPKKSSIQLESVLFNHGRANAICSINIRKDDTFIWPTPEWKRGRDMVSPAVYRLARFGINQDVLEIDAVFMASSSTDKVYYVRVDGGTLFGMSNRQRIPCGPNRNNTHTVHFRFSNAGQSLTAQGIKKHSLTLTWQYSESAAGTGDYTTLQSTEHTIYTIWDSVHAPWGAAERIPVPVGNRITQTLYPATDAYDATIQIFKDVVLTTNPMDTIKAAVTKYIYECGYYTYIGDSSLLLCEGICLDSLLEYLESPKEGTQYPVNCTDCAALVIAIANLYGCHLHQLVLGKHYHVNKIKLIGEDDWRYPHGNPPQTFDFHVLAIDSSYNPEIPSTFSCYDSCFMYHGNITQNEQLAVNVPFCVGNLPAQNIDTYKESICTQQGLGECHVERCGAIGFFF